jgi:drug/metabolite transporter (DMT)-like permease
VSADYVTNHVQKNAAVTAVLISLASAVFFGAADFLGGLASRRASTIAIVVISQLAGLVALALMLPFLPESSPVRSDWLWGGTAGLAGGIGVALLYRGLALGSMAVVAPVTAVCAVVLPVVVAIALGERPGARAMSGIGLALAAIVLVSRPAASAHMPATFSSSSKSAVRVAIASGVAIGLFYITIAQTRPDAGMWPLAAARGVSFALFAAIALAAGRSVRMPAAVVSLAVVGGVLDMFANVLYLLATRHGQLSVVVTLSSLYPASTVLLARTVLGERLSWLQTTGVVCAFIAVVLIVSI